MPYMNFFLLITGCPCIIEEVERLSVQDRKKEYRIIFERLWKTPRASNNEIVTILGKRTVDKRLQKALDQKIIVGPDIRKRSYRNLKEYMYFLKCDDPDSEYLKYRGDQRIIYHALTIGFCNLWLITKEKIDIEGDIVLEGYRSDYFTSRPPDHTWETAMEIINKKIQTFNPEAYIKKGYIKTHLDETIPWDETDEILYRYFKYDLRKSTACIMKKQNISGGKVYQFLENLSRTCTIATHFYPGTLSAYESYLFMFETDYEDFIIDLFSELPTSVSFFKISGRLFIYTHILKPLVRRTDPDEINKWYIPFLLLELSRKGIVKSRERASVDYSWSKRI